MSNRLFQGVVHQMRDTIGRVIGVIDENSTIVACSELSRIGTNSDFFTIELGDSHDVFIRDGYTYKPFGVHVKARLCGIHRRYGRSGGKVCVYPRYLTVKHQAVL